MTIYSGDQEALFNNIKSNSIDAIITDPPYGLAWSHKIETNFNFEQFLTNAHRVIKENGFLVYFGQEPSMSHWNCLAQQKFKYLAEIIWYKRGPSGVFQYPLRVHEKIMIFTKGKGKLNKATIDWEDEKAELIDYIPKAYLVRSIATVKILLKRNKSKEELLAALQVDRVKKERTTNDGIYDNMGGGNRDRAMFYPKKLTTLWGCRSHNQQRFNKPEYNVKHPTVKPLQVTSRLLEMTTQEDHTVLDPFMGSGTTGVVAKTLKRNFIGFEIFPEYYQLAKDRIDAA